jgi:hypothetical protein
VWATAFLEKFLNLQNFFVPILPFKKRFLVCLILVKYAILKVILAKIEWGVGVFVRNDEGRKSTIFFRWKR